MSLGVSANIYSTLLGAVFHFHGFQYIHKLTAPKFVSQQVFHPEIMPFGHIDNSELQIFERQPVKDTLNLPHEMYLPSAGKGEGTLITISREYRAQ